MKDCLGNELKIGDMVVYVNKFSKYGTELKIGYIYNIRVLFGKETAYFSDNWFDHGVQKTNIMKLEK